MTFLDLDNFLNDQSIETLRVNGYSTYEYGTNVSFVDGTFSSTVYGAGIDNPEDPRSLTEAQRAKSVAFLFENTASFRATLAVTNGGVGRNFMFSGNSNVPADCGIPPVSAPLPLLPPSPVMPPAPPGETMVTVVKFRIVVAGDLES